MYRVSEMIGKTVVSVDSGEKLGTVSDALVETSAVRLMGLVVTHGMLGKEQVLPLEDVQRVGRDAVLARTNEHLMDRKQWRETEIATTRTSTLRGKTVVSGAGERIGQVSDLLVDELSGALSGLEVETRSLGGLKTKRSVLSPTPTPKIGRDAVVVSEESLPTDSAEPESPAAEAPVQDERGSER